jgi:phospholipase C
MQITDRGYRFSTVHNEDGNVAHVQGRYRRFQTQSPIRRNQPYELEFYGRGAGLTLGVTAVPRRAEPAVAAAARRRITANPRRSAANRASLTSSGLTPSDLSGSRPRSPSTMAFTVGPDFQSPFDRDWTDWWDLEPPTLPPPDLPPGGGGGGGGGSLQSAVRIELFVFGTAEPVQTWELPEGVSTPERQVTYAPEGFPAADAPVRRTTWWRVVVTPIGPDPVEIGVAAYVRIADVPIRTTPLSVRLTNHLFRVALEALVPRAVVDWDTLSVSIGPEIADLLGVAPTIITDSISPGNSHARLRSLDITTVSGQELRNIALEHYRERARRYPLPPSFVRVSDVDQLVHLFFASQLVRLSQVQPDDVCIRIQAAFTDASVSVWGFDVASLRGELGELILAFDHRAQTLRPFSFLDVDFTTIGSIAWPIVAHFKEVPSDVNQIIEDDISEHETQQRILEYMRAFVARAVGQSSTFHEFRLQDNAWQIRHSDDPVIPLPSDWRPPIGGGPLNDVGIIGLLARHSARLGSDTPPRATEGDVAASNEPLVETRATDASASDLPASEPAASELPSPTRASTPTRTTRALPGGSLTEREQLDRLDRHQSIVIVMMENRSYDHMLGDLTNARPRPSNPYDGPPANVMNRGVAGFLHGVPLVHTRELHLGTAIPVSPRHSYHPVQFQIGDGTADGRSTGDMLGFARDLYLRSDSPQLACTIYGEEELPVHYRLADEFLTCERWFSAHPGPTWPNRFAMVMGSSPDLDNFEVDDPRIGYLKGRTIYDALSGARIEWRVFESDLSLVRTFDRYRLDNRNVVPINDEIDGLEATLRRPGALPRVMFVEPNFADIPPFKTADDDHPPADLAHGQAFLSRVCDLLWDTGRFDEVLLVITYDEHGGFYDHVPPPGTPRSGTGPYPRLVADGPTWLGVRVPAFVVSPYVSAGGINRTIFDHTSILKTILVHNRARFSEAVMLGFGDRVNQARDLSAVLDLSSPRQAPVPFVRRTAPTPGRPRFGDVLDLQTITAAARASTLSSPPSVSGVTPRNVVVTQRTVRPTDRDWEPRDFHGALANMLKPRWRQ